MKTKTIFIIAFTAIITIFLMINTDAVEFNFIFVKKDISKLLVVGVCTFVGFILGYMAGRPKTTVSSYDRVDTPLKTGDHKNALSDEDRDYIS
nr:LapA family protein [Pedobacter panaciterrae]